MHVFRLAVQPSPLLFGNPLTKSFYERMSHFTGCSERACTKSRLILLRNIWIFRCTPSLGHPWLICRKLRAWNPKNSTLTPPDLQASHVPHAFKTRQQGKGTYIHPAKEGHTIHVVLVLKSDRQESRQWSQDSFKIWIRRAIHARLEGNLDIIMRPFFAFRQKLSLIHIWRCRRYAVCRSRWSPYH